MCTRDRDGGGSHGEKSRWKVHIIFRCIALERRKNRRRNVQLTTHRLLKSSTVVTGAGGKCGKKIRRTTHVLTWLLIGGWVGGVFWTRFVPRLRSPRSPAALWATFPTCYYHRVLRPKPTRVGKYPGLGSRSRAIGIFVDPLIKRWQSALKIQRIFRQNEKQKQVDSTEKLLLAFYWEKKSLPFLTQEIFVEFTVVFRFILFWYAVRLLLQSILVPFSI